MYIPDSVNEFAAQTVCTVPDSSRPVVEGLPVGAENNKTSETTLIKPFGQLLHRKQYPTCGSVPIYLEFCRLMALSFGCPSLVWARRLLGWVPRCSVPPLLLF